MKKIISLIALLSVSVVSAQNRGAVFSPSIDNSFSVQQTMNGIMMTGSLTLKAPDSARNAVFSVPSGGGLNLLVDNGGAADSTFKFSGLFKICPNTTTDLTASTWTLSGLTMAPGSQINTPFLNVTSTSTHNGATACNADVTLVGDGTDIVFGSEGQMRGLSTEHEVMVAPVYNKLVLTSQGNAAKSHSLGATPTHPTLFMYSATNPETSIKERTMLWNDTQNFNIRIGTGSTTVGGNLLIKPNKHDAPDVDLYTSTWGARGLVMAPDTPIVHARKTLAQLKLYSPANIGEVWVCSDTNEIYLSTGTGQYAFVKFAKSNPD